MKPRLFNSVSIYCLHYLIHITLSVYNCFRHVIKYPEGYANTHFVRSGEKNFLKFLYIYEKVFMCYHVNKTDGQLIIYSFTISSDTCH